MYDKKTVASVDILGSNHVVRKSDARLLMLHLVGEEPTAAFNADLRHVLRLVCPRLMSEKITALASVVSNFVVDRFVHQIVEPAGSCVFRNHKDSGQQLG